MKYFIILICILLLTGSSELRSNSDIFNIISRAEKFDPGNPSAVFSDSCKPSGKQYLAVFFFSIGSCLKCYNFPTAYLALAEEGITFKRFAFISSSRLREAKKYAKENGWKYPFGLLDAAIYEKLGIVNGTSVAIFDQNGKMIFSGKESFDVRELKDKIIKNSKEWQK